MSVWPFENDLNGKVGGRMKRMLAVSALTMAVLSLALGQISGTKANYSNQKDDSVE